MNNKCIIFTTQRAPNGRAIHYNIDLSTTQAAELVEDALSDGTFVRIPNEDDGAPIFVNPECVATITPIKED